MIYDCFMFFENLELLELRLMTLNEVVDRFVIVELGVTHMNVPKPLHFENNKDRFEKYLPKIIHIKYASIPYNGYRQMEIDNRNLMAEGYVGAAPDDYIIISDEDEIPSPEGILEGIKAGYECFAMRQKLFYYYVNCIAAQEWEGCMVYQKRLIPSPQWIRDRRGQGNGHILNGGWHYSFLGSPRLIMNKLSHFSEQQVNTPDVNNEENIRRCMETGEDMFHRTEWYAQKHFLRRDELDHPTLDEWLKKYPHNFRNVNGC
jgi:hypothetical protein